MTTLDKLFKALEDREHMMIDIRRHLHEHPELSFEEEETGAYIKDFYKGKDVTMTHPVEGQHALIVDIEGGKPGKTIALRADFDALPIQEETDLPFKSKNDGVMHACGHDVHTANLMALADALIEIKDELPGTIRIVHQHAEEVVPGGAKSVMASKALDNVDEIYGIHVAPNAPPGVVAYTKGYAFAGSSVFTLKLQGRGGHAATPHRANDALIAGTKFVDRAQTIVSRHIDPKASGVVTIGSFHAPGGFNAIQNEVTIKGTIRYLKDELGQSMYEQLQQIVKGIEDSYGVEAKLDFQFGYPVLYNHPDETESVVQTLKQSQGNYIKQVFEVPPLMGAEDFAYYVKDIPGTFFIVGCMPEGVTDPYGNHHPKFEVNEACMLVASKSLGEIALNRLTQT
ncbi:amidohydrolase [Staphylococcus massiliensis]|uniref:amidohydrolase n=1 Tax=Staphylococcus massiliensis TaxID=555791 RepID=UPI001EDEE449|nr:amidohydrolase [Staphylococcus massiliensis]MCG3398796.1 amidohydrolase [Staphylococcus massiliensis]MCG3401357.1 amidohydrolase [Staphylococcus massiliensis]